MISQRTNQKCEIFADNLKLKQKEPFKYLETLITNDGKNYKEVIVRIAKAKMGFQKKKSILTNTKISIVTRMKTLQCYIKPILMYGGETWTITKEIGSSLNVAFKENA